MRGASHVVHIRRLVTRNGRGLHTINVVATRRVESLPKFVAAVPKAHYLQPVSSFRRLSSSTSTNTMDSITQSLAGLSITPTATVTHAETSSPASWREAIKASPSAPTSFELIKTIVFKPKTAKTAATVPVVVIARDDTETSSGALGKKLNLKELRLASEDLLTEFFSLDKNSCE